MGSIEFSTKDLSIIDKVYVRHKEPNNFIWCRYKYLNRADFSLVSNKIIVNTRDFSRELDKYYLKKQGTKYFYIVPEDYDKTNHYSFAWQEVTKEEFISEYKKRKEKKNGCRNLCANEITA